MRKFIIQKGIFPVAVCVLGAAPLSAQTQWINYDSTYDTSIGRNAKAIVVDAQGNKWFGFGNARNPANKFGVVMYNDTVWKGYSTIDGLIDNRVLAIAIDALGSKWFGTQGGVSKFDGSSWTSYTIDSGLVGNWIQAIAIDSQGNKWFGTNVGISKYNGVTWDTFSTDNSTLTDNNIHCIAVDGLGNKWFGTDLGLFKFNDTSWTNYAPWNANGGLGGTGAVYAISIDGQGDKWFATDFALWKLHDTTCTMYGGPYYDLYGFFMGSAFSIVFDRNQKIWLGSQDMGVITFDVGANVWVAYNLNAGTGEGLNATYIASIAIDSQQNIWAGSDIGIHKFPATPNGVIPPANAAFKRNNYSFSIKNGHILIDFYSQIACSVIDISGRTLLRRSGRISRNIDIPTGSLSSGCYFLRISAGNEQTIQRFISTGRGNTRHVR